MRLLGRPWRVRGEVPEGLLRRAAHVRIVVRLRRLEPGYRARIARFLKHPDRGLPELGPGIVEQSLDARAGLAGLREVQPDQSVADHAIVLILQAGAKRLQSQRRTLAPQRLDDIGPDAGVG